MNEANVSNCLPLLSAIKNLPNAFKNAFFIQSYKDE